MPRIVTNATFHTGATAPLPTTLGTLTADQPGVGALHVSSGGMCSTTISAAVAAVDITLAAEALPWKGALSFRTVVDGAPWTYHSNDFDIPGLGGRMHEMLYASCQGEGIGLYHGLEVGTHTVWMEATIPGSATVLKTESISVTLSCPSPSGTGGGGGGVGGGGGTGGGGNVSSGCRMGSGGQDGAWAIALLAALATLGRRRR